MILAPCIYTLNNVLIAVLRLDNDNRWFYLNLRIFEKLHSTKPSSCRFFSDRSRADLPSLLTGLGHLLGQELLWFVSCHCDPLEEGSTIHLDSLGKGGFDGKLQLKTSLEGTKTSSINLFFDNEIKLFIALQHPFRHCLLLFSRQSSTITTDNR